MSITYHARPGISVAYDTTSRTQAQRPRIVGLAALDATAQAGDFASAEAALAALGTAGKLGKMAQLAFLGGASRVICCPVAANSAAGYASAFATLLAERTLRCLATDCENSAALAALAEQMRPERDQPCLAVASLCYTGVSTLLDLAHAVNSERVVLLAADARFAGDELNGGSGLAAASLAGLICAQEDPALPLSGAILPGIDAMSLNFSESEFDALAAGGVCPVECVGAQMRLIRAVTSRVTTDGVPDATWRELSTVCIVDEVIPAVRDVLAARFLRRKNTALTRNAIRAQVAIILDERVRREIIESYDSLRVEPTEGDPTTCEVSFSFTVVQALLRICLRVHILV